VSAEIAVSPWTARGERANELRDRYSFASEVLTLYLALLPVQGDAWRAARESQPAPAELARWAAARVLPGIVEATAAAGPATLREQVRSLVADGVDEDVLAAWLAGADLHPVDGYLARASLAPVLEALGGRAGEACAPARTGKGGAFCPSCRGLPQVSCVTDSGESLVSGRRNLLCARCGSSWDYTRTACPSCGEADETRLLVYSEHWEGAVSLNGNGAGPAVFPHLRIAGCETCRRYLIEVDMALDGRAVPEVDELAALPLDLYAVEQGLTKVTPNLMGF
jgi:FdhE protein